MTDKTVANPADQNKSAWDEYKNKWTKLYINTKRQKLDKYSRVCLNSTKKLQAPYQWSKCQISTKKFTKINQNKSL